MKKIHTSPDRLLINHFKNILESYNMSCVITNEFLAGAAGELPPLECWPELWVVNDAHYDKAKLILEQIRCMNETTTLLSWQCSCCGEKIEGQFTACWYCGENRDK